MYVKIYRTLYIEMSIHLIEFNRILNLANYSRKGELQVYDYSLELELERVLWLASLPHFLGQGHTMMNCL